MMTQKEKIPRLLQKCFTPREWTFLVMDPAFRKLAEGAETLDDVEVVSKRGAVILLEAEFSRDPNWSKNPRAGRRP